MNQATSPEKQQHILIVDDDRGIRDLLGKFFQQHGYKTTLARDAKETELLLAKDSFDLIILDIMMPGENGLTLCQNIRKDSTVPIIMLTAVSEDIERILGLEMGADDYLSKPFNPRELLARVRALFRRASVTAKAAEAADDILVYRFSGWSLNPATRQLLSPDEVEISLSTGEYDLLLVFLKHPQIVLSRDQLLDHTRNREAGPFDRSIDIQISRLRHKIEADPKKPEIIKTVRGGGYVLSTTVEK